MKTIDFEKVVKRLRGSKYDDGYIIDQVISDLQQLTPEQATRYVLEFSPSKLGRLGYLGLRKLAIIRRDDPEFFRYLIS